MIADEPKTWNKGNDEYNVRLSDIGWIVTSPKWPDEAFVVDRVTLENLKDPRFLEAIEAVKMYLATQRS